MAANPDNWDWYGVNPNAGDGYKISTDINSGTALGGRMSIGNSGRGPEYWKKASRGDPDTSALKSTSSGWFIDKIEGFRPFESDLKYFHKGERDWAAQFTQLHYGMTTSSGSISFQVDNSTGYGPSYQDY